MKNKLTEIIIIGLFLCATFGQEQNKYGVGFEFHTLPTTFAQGQGTPLGVLFPIVTQSIIVEPLIIYSNSTVEIDYDSGGYEDTKTTISDLTLLVGIFIPKNRGKIRSYVGIRVGKSWYEADYDGGNNDEEVDYLILAPTIGAEYFISENFSFGGEGMYTMVSSEIDEDEYKITTNQHTIMPRFIARFYFK